MSDYFSIQRNQPIKSALFKIRHTITSQNSMTVGGLGGRKGQPRRRLVNMEVPKGSY